MSEADVVRLIYHELAEEGRSCAWAADYLTRLGVPPAYARDGREITRGKRKVVTSGIWRPGRVRNLVVNTTYKGIHVFCKRSKKQREWIEREVPALVSVATWERAQEALRCNCLFNKRNAKRQYLLRGLIKCGLCGLTYIGTGYSVKKQINNKTIKTGVERTYYTYNGKQGARGIYGLNYQRCPSKAVSGSIEDVVWADVEDLLRNSGNLLQQFQARVLDQADEADRLRKQAAELQQALQAQAKERDLVVGLFRKGRINGGTLDRQLDQIQQEEAGLKDAIAALTAKARGAEEAATQLRSAEDMLRTLCLRLDEPLTWERKRQLIESLIESIVAETIGDEGLPQKDKQAVVIMKYRFGSTQKVELTPAQTCTDTGSSVLPE